MRQMFSSARLENVEAVEKLFNEAGIETKMTKGRTYRGNSRREFSYHGKMQAIDPSQYPAVWVLKADDYKKAREILHEAGLLEEKQQDSFLPDNLRFRDQTENNPQKKLLRIKLILLGIIAAMAFAMTMRIIFANT
jgi:hypothetical protein